MSNTAVSIKKHKHDPTQQDNHCHTGRALKSSFPQGDKQSAGPNWPQQGAKNWGDTRNYANALFAPPEYLEILPK